jgi:hypothetical protein
LPPPACTAPVELEALFEPGVIAAGELAVTVCPAAVCETVGLADCGVDCTAPVEPLELLPPPVWAAPVELLAVFPPPVVDAGAETLAVAVLPCVVAAGLAETAPACTTPVELVAVLPGSAAALPATPSAAAARTAARPGSLCLNMCSTLFLSRSCVAGTHPAGPVSEGAD